MRVECAEFTHTLPPGPVTRHKITVSSPFVLKLTVGNVIDVVGQTGVCKDVVDDLSRVTIPELILSGHPLRCRCVVWADTTVVGSIGLPGYMSECDCVDRCVKVVVVKYWRRVIVGN